MSTVLDQIKASLPLPCAQLLDRRDGAVQLIRVLREQIDPTEEGACHVWDGCARFYTMQGRFYEALAIYHSMYDKLMEMQDRLRRRIHKGTPLVRISDVHGLMSRPLLAKRYIMLTVCEDAINCKGNIPSENSGSYFRAVWHHGMSDEQFRAYASAAWNASQEDAEASRFPEWALQKLDHKWIVEYPSSNEASFYVANPAYVRWLLSKLGAGDGQALERLAHYLISCVPGFRARMRMRTLSTDYDVYCAVEGPTFDFRSELGSYFLTECKDWSDTVGVTHVVKFAGVLRSAKCRFGIIFSKNGISGQGDTKYADRERLKIQQDGITIVSISRTELDEVAAGANFFSIVRDLYERERLDLPKHPPQKRRSKT